MLIWLIICSIRSVLILNLNLKFITETESHSVREEKTSKGKDAAGSKPGEDGKLAAPGAQKDATALSM